MSMVNDQTLLLGLLSDSNRVHEQAVLDEMQARGARVLTLAEEDALVAFESGIPEAGQAALYLPVLQPWLRIVLFPKA